MGENMYNNDQIICENTCRLKYSKKGQERLPVGCNPYNYIERCCPRLIKFGFLRRGVLNEMIDHNVREDDYDIDCRFYNLICSQILKIIIVCVSNGQVYENCWSCITRLFLRTFPLGVMQRILPLGIPLLMEKIVSLQHN